MLSFAYHRAARQRPHAPSAAGGIVLISAIAPLEEARAAARAHSLRSGGGASGVGEGAGWFEVHVATRISTCAERDVKGIYRAAAIAAATETSAAASHGQQRLDVTGVTHPWEFPVAPDVVIDTVGLPALDDAVLIVITALVQAGFIVKPAAASPRAHPNRPPSAAAERSASSLSQRAGDGLGGAALVPVAQMSEAEAALAAALSAAMVGSPDAWSMRAGHVGRHRPSPKNEPPWWFQALESTGVASRLLAEVRDRALTLPDVFRRFFPSLRLPRQPVHIGTGILNASVVSGAADVDPTRHLCSPHWDSMGALPVRNSTLNVSLWAGRPGIGSAGSMSITHAKGTDSQITRSQLVPHHIVLALSWDERDASSLLPGLVGVLVDARGKLAVSARTITMYRRTLSEEMWSLTQCDAAKHTPCANRTLVRIAKSAAPATAPDAEGRRVGASVASMLGKVQRLRSTANEPVVTATSAGAAEIWRLNDDFMSAVEASVTGQSGAVVARVPPEPLSRLELPGMNDALTLENKTVELGPSKAAAARAGDVVAIAWDIWATVRFTPTDAAALGGARSHNVGGERADELDSAAPLIVAAVGPRALRYVRHFMQFDPCLVVIGVIPASDAATTRGWSSAVRALASDYPERASLWT